MAAEASWRHDGKERRRERSSVRTSTRLKGARLMPRQPHSRTQDVVIDEWVVSLHGPATLAVPQLEAERTMVNREITALIAKMRTSGIHLTTS